MSKILHNQETKERAKETLQLISETLKDDSSKTIFQEQLIHGFSVMSNAEGERYEKFKARMWDNLNNSINTLLDNGNTLPKSLFPLLKDLTTNPDAKKLIDSIEHKFVKDYPQSFTESKDKDSTPPIKSELVNTQKKTEINKGELGLLVINSKSKKPQDIPTKAHSQSFTESKDKDSIPPIKSEPVNTQEKTEHKTNTSSKLLNEIVKDLEELIQNSEIKKGIGIKNFIELKEQVNSLKSGYEKASTLEEKSNCLVEKLEKLQAWSNEKSSETEQPIFVKVKNLFSSMGKVVKSIVNKNEEKLIESKTEYFQAKQNLFHTKGIKDSLNQVQEKAQNHAEKIKTKREEAASQKPRTR